METELVDVTGTSSRKPTVIRRGAAGPGRPAPTAPARPAPAPPRPAARTSVPQRTESMKQDTAAKPTVLSRKPSIPPSSKPKPAAGKRKLEITIVSAQPMTSTQMTAFNTGGSVASSSSTGTNQPTQEQVNTTTKKKSAPPPKPPPPTRPPPPSLKSSTGGKPGPTILRPKPVTKGSKPARPPPASKKVPKENPPSYNEVLKEIHQESPQTALLMAELGPNFTMTPAPQPQPPRPATWSTFPPEEPTQTGWASFDETVPKRSDPPSVPPPPLPSTRPRKAYKHPGKTSADSSRSGSPANEIENVENTKPPIPTQRPLSLDSSSSESSSGKVPPPVPSTRPQKRASISSVSSAGSEVLSYGLPDVIPKGGTDEETSGSGTEQKKAVPGTKKKAPPRPTSGPTLKRMGSNASQTSKPRMVHSSSVESSSSVSSGKPDSVGGSEWKAPPLPKRPGPGHPLFHYLACDAHGIAQFDYEAAQDDELSFKAGDAILLIERVNADWLLGRVGSTKGLCPQSFVKVIIPLPGDAQDGTPAAPGSGPRAVALYDFEPGQSDDLGFNKGDTIFLLGKVGSEWYRGKCGKKEGMFPATYVNVVEDLPWKEPAQEKADTIRGPHCKARFDFEGESEGDLSFEEGDVISLLERVGDEWMKGELKGKAGIFPLSFVEVVENLPVDTVTATPSGDGAVVNVLYDFEGENSDELSVKAGKKLKVLSIVSADWLLGEVDGRQGRFPASFVDHIPSNVPAAPAEPSGNGTQGSSCYIAKYDFVGQSEGELSFKAGDRMSLISELDADWLTVMIDSNEGVVPRSYVEPAGGGGGGDGGSRPKALVLYDFEAVQEEELSLKEGEEVYLKEVFDDNWLVGEVKGRVGRFPVAFVQIITPLP
ncbi:SH3D19 [Branchiostoma lanceolatum]|uniref:SH3D19 protein n=1 Tax=Branchiostoma lanceolatum TaxID=7740 RepID=A0A8K0A4Y6_BRALA|nr:SH3D19 [Branchiostoma lanceolatum]